MKVHKARLWSGEEVAVKVQHKQVRMYAAADIESMFFLTRLVRKLFAEFEFMWLAEVTRRNLPLELDFVHEGHNAERIAALLSHQKHAIRVHIPSVHWPLTTSRVLVMEYCAGGSVADTAYIRRERLPVAQVLARLSELYNSMIFEHGFLHADPHPGNVLVRWRTCDSRPSLVRRTLTRLVRYPLARLGLADALLGAPDARPREVELVLLDHGLYQPLGPETRTLYAKLWLSLIRFDVERLKRYSERLGCPEFYGMVGCMVTGRSWDHIAAGHVGAGGEKGVRNAAELEDIQRDLRNYWRGVIQVFLRTVLPRFRASGELHSHPVTQSIRE